jgi:hypothetical protein
MGLEHMAIYIAISLSVAASVISVVGMAAIFSGSFWEVIVVTSILETAKVITATWLHRHWKSIGTTLKVYLSSAVIVLMFITSLGIYGFFAKAHIEQQISITTGDASQITIVQSKIDTEKSRLADLNRQLSFIETSLRAITERTSGQKALQEAEKQKKNSSTLLVKKDEVQQKIINLETEKNLLENNVKKQEVKVGPLKYLANIYYGSASNEQLENAVRFLILVIVLVFDPLAIALLIAVGGGTQKNPSLIKIRRRRIRKPKVA